MGGQGRGASSIGKRRPRRALARLAIALSLIVVVVSLFGSMAGADDLVVPLPDPVAPIIDPPADTTPPPDVPPETTAPEPTAPETTAPETTAPSTTAPESTNPGGPTTTTEPEPSSTTGAPTTTAPTAPTTTPPGDVPRLDPKELLAPRPELAALSPRLVVLIDALQRATDAYALRRVAWLDLVGQLQPAQVELAESRAAEQAAASREVAWLVTAGTDDELHESSKSTDRSSRGAVIDDRLDAFRASKRRLATAHKAARSAREHAEATLTDVTTRLDALSRTVFDAARVRADAESAIEQELGPGAILARPDGTTFTLVVGQAGQPDSIVLGGIVMPIPGARLSSPFGLRNDPLGGGAGFHPGVDFAAASGTPIRAAADGTVVTAGDCGGYGNCVVIDHGVSLATLYGHQSLVLVTVGQWVAAGQVIGLVGSTGNSTGPHLHFEVRVHGLPIDPLLALVPT